MIVVEVWYMPKHIKLLDGLKKGDVIVVLGVQEKSQAVNEETIRVQKLIERQYGLNEATHLAIAKEDGQVAHLIGQVNIASEEEFFKYYAGCAFVIYRPKDKEFSDAIFKTLQNDDDILKNIKWKRHKAIRSFLPSIFHPTTDNTKISEESVCSKFVVQILRKACILYDKNPNEYIGVSSNSMPKRVDDYLYGNDHYDLYVKPKYLPYCPLPDLMVSIIEEAIDYYKNDISVSSQKKRIAVESALNKAAKFIVAFENEHKKELNHIEKAIIYMVFVKKPLSAKLGIFASKHYKKLVSLLNENGIREADYSSLTLNDLKDRLIEKEPKPVVFNSLK